MYTQTHTERDIFTSLLFNGNSFNGGYFAFNGLKRLTDANRHLITVTVYVFVNLIPVVLLMLPSAQSTQS